MNTKNLVEFIETWMAAWNSHDLDGVLRAMADDVVFVHWTGGTICGKRLLRLA